MDKAEEFMKVVLTNLQAQGVNIRYKNIITAANLRNGIKNYFGYTTEESITKMNRILGERGFLEVNIHGFKITEKSVKLLGGNKEDRNI